MFLRYPCLIFGTDVHQTDAKQQAHNQMHINNQERHHLLALPAELRDKIFEEAVVEPEPIEFTGANTVVPGIITASVQTRRETLRMFYSRNTFRPVSIDYNAAALVVDSQLLDFNLWRFGGHPSSALLRICNRGVPNWENFAKWCEIVFEQINDRHIKLTRPNETTLGQFEACALASAETISWADEGTWEDLDEMLEGTRKMLVRLDPAWAE